MSNTKNLNDSEELDVKQDLDNFEEGAKKKKTKAKKSSKKSSKKSKKMSRLVNNDSLDDMLGGKKSKKSSKKGSKKSSKKSSKKGSKDSSKLSRVLEMGLVGGKKKSSKQSSKKGSKMKRTLNPALKATQVINEKVLKEAGAERSHWFGLITYINTLRKEAKKLVNEKDFEAVNKKIMELFEKDLQSKGKAKIASIIAKFAEEAKENRKKKAKK
jgi:hypothetical protein